MQVIIFFIYGLVFFVLWLSIVIYPKKNSSFKLADKLWLLAAFGLAHGIHEWVDMFMLIQIPIGMNYLKIISFMLRPLSFYFLLEFGARLIVETQTKYHALKVMPPILLGVWVVVAVSGGDFTTGDVFARYLLGLPGTAMAAVAMVLKISTFEKIRLQSITPYLKWAAGGFCFYGLFSGLVVPDSDFFPASVLNYSLFINKVGLPVQLFRTVSALVITYSLVRILSVFDWETKEAMRKSEERYKNLFNASLDGIFRVNTEGVFTMMNLAGANIFGYERPDEIIGVDALEFWLNPGDRDSYRAELKLNKSVSSYPIKARKRNGEPIALESSSTMVEDEKGNFIGIEGILRDVTRRKQVEEELRHLSVVDELTGLNNRRGFLILATQQIKIADRMKRGAVLVFADMDKMKWVNDTFGHKEGDRALIDMANMLRNAFRASDVIARWGGDEFVGLALESNENTEEVLRMRLQESLDAHNVKAVRPYKLSISFGLARYDPDSPCALEELLERGDTLMYEEKQGKKVARREDYSGRA